MKLPKLLFCLAVVALVAGAQDHRSLCLLFDLNSMSAPDQLRVQEAAIKFVEEQMKPSDLVSVITFTSELKVVQDFSGDHDILLAALRKIVPSATNAAVDINSRLQAVQNAAAILEAVPGKKSLIYFANGISPTGADNQAQLKATVDATVRANGAIYPVDTGALSPSPR
jgi:VWFA-related protein